MFYEKNFVDGKKEIVITDNLLKLRDTFQYRNLDQEVEARWKLVETAWSLEVNRNLLQVQYSEDDKLLFVQSNAMRRVNITFVYIGDSGPSVSLEDGPLVSVILGQQL